jgi:uncharacterized protein with PQ loop repeat
MIVAATVAVLTTICSVAVKVVGMPDQIKSNYRRKSTSGLSRWFMLSTLISYALWVVHGVQVHDMSLVIGQGLGVLVTGVVVAQMWVYRAPAAAPRSRPVKVRRPKLSLASYLPIAVAIFRRKARAAINQ